MRKSQKKWSAPTLILQKTISFQINLINSTQRAPSTLLPIKQLLCAMVFYVTLRRQKEIRGRKSQECEGWGGWNMGAWKRPLIFQYVVTSSSTAKKCREPTGMRRGRRETEGVRGARQWEKSMSKRFAFSVSHIMTSRHFIQKGFEEWSIFLDVSASLWLHLHSKSSKC